MLTRSRSRYGLAKDKCKPSLFPAAICGSLQEGRLMTNLLQHRPGVAQEHRSGEGVDMFAALRLDFMDERLQLPVLDLFAQAVGDSPIVDLRRGVESVDKCQKRARIGVRLERDRQASGVPGRIRRRDGQRMRTELKRVKRNRVFYPFTSWTSSHIFTCAPSTPEAPSATAT